MKYLPGSFTCRGAFPALVKFRLHACPRLVEFPEVHEGALPQLRTLDFSGCESLRTLPLSLEVLTSLRKLIVSDCDLTPLVGNIVISPQYGVGFTSNLMNFRESHSLDVRKSRGWTFSSHDM